MKFWSMRRERTRSVDSMDGLVSTSSFSSSSSSASSSSSSSSSLFGDSGWTYTFSFSSSSSSSSSTSSSSSSTSSSSSSSLSRNFAVLQFVLLLLAFLVHPAQSSPPSTSSSSSSSIARRLLRFNYMTNGLDWPEVCTGPRSLFQSPIDIPLDNIILVPELGDLKHRATYPVFTGNVSVRHDNSTISILFPGENTMRMPKFRAQKPFNGSANMEWDAANYGPQEGYNNDHACEERGKWSPVSKTYQLLECHFHSVSETEIDGTHADLEMHCVHTRGGYPALGVWGVLFNRTASENDTKCNPFVDKIVEALGELAACPPFQTISVDVGTFSLAHLLPEDGTYFHFYPGSLTTPPCTEGLLWYIFKKPLPVCDHQVREIQNFVQFLSGLPALNYREVQPLNGRRIYCWEDDLDIVDSRRR